MQLGDDTQPSGGRLALELVAASFAVLFLELALIRWVGGQVRVLAYFPNLILIASFLGLGLGALRSGRPSLLWLWPPALVALAAGTVALSRVAFTQRLATEHLWLLYHDLPPGAPVVPSVRLPILLCFVASAAAFLPLGQAVAERLGAFRARSKPLLGYGFDLGGSLLGVIAFTATSFLRAPPVAWFAAAFAVGAVLYLQRPRLLVVHLAAAAAVLAIVAKYDRATHYSPYYALQVITEPAGVMVRTNGSVHQVGFSLARDAPVRADWHANQRGGYHLPYRVLARPPGRVLVLGAGTGNDVAVALDEGAAEVHAVEIDPVILEIGAAFHPDHPYASPRVRTFNTDARSFLNDTTERYDLVVFGTLDSMTRLSALSNVRLDNFVYTLECLAAARARLTPEGGIILYFAAANDSIDGRLAGLVARAFDERPIMVREHFGLFNRIYLGGPAFRHANPAGRAGAESFLATLPERHNLPTDDWPYLYLAARGVSPFYLSVMAAIVALSIAGVAAASGAMRRSLLRGGAGADVEMLLFGLAFLLLETRFVTEMNLAWGATWLTSAVVFAAILGTILVSTALAAARPLPFGVAAIGLLAALVAGYALPARLLVGAEPIAKLALSTLYVGAPVFFAAQCFALRFKERERVELAFGWNLLGAVLGGLIEFASMAIGLKALSLVAAAAYLCAFWLGERARRAAAPT